MSTHSGMRRIFLKLFPFSFLILFASPVFPITYLHILVDGEDVTTHVQGTPYFFFMDCDPLDTVYMEVIRDLNGNGIVDPEEHSFLPPGIGIVDNAPASPDGPPFFDDNATQGLINIPMFFHLPVGHWIIGFGEDGITIYHPLEVVAPDPLFGSVSGRLVFEGITPPDSRLANLFMYAGYVEPSPPFLMLFFTSDDYGNFQFNWPDGPMMIGIMLVGGGEWLEAYNRDDFGTGLYVDGHITGFEMFIRLASTTGLSYFRIYINDTTESYVQHQGDVQVFAMDCNPYSSVVCSFFPDYDADSVIDPDEEEFFSRAFEDNFTGMPGDMDMTEGVMRYQFEYNLPPGHYNIVAREGSRTVMVHYEVLPPEPYLMSVSGRITLEGIASPDPIYPMIRVALSTPWWPYTYYLGTCDEYGNYVCNWGNPPGDFVLRILPPYPSDDYDFASVWMSGYIATHITGFDVFLPSLSSVDSILVIFEQDSGLWVIRQNEIEVAYTNLASGDTFFEFNFPDSGEIKIPVLSMPCEIVFKGNNPYFPEHNFLSPYEPIPISPSSYPPEIHLYADQTNHHFKLFLDGFALDSVPEEGIGYRLYGLSPEGHEYYSDARLFIQYIGGEYVVAGGRELCDGDWTVVLPSILPGNFVPAVTETTITIPEVFTWPHYDLHIPVTSGIVEKMVPDKIALSIHPNPFNSSVSIDFAVNEPGAVSIEIYNVMGKCVATIDENIIAKGTYRASWNCTDESGLEVPTGLYLFRMTASNEMSVVKGMFMK